MPQIPLKPNRDLVRLGKNIQKARIDADLSQQGLADNANLSRSALSAIENGQSPARADNLIRLARALGITPANLFDGIG